MTDSPNTKYVNVPHEVPRDPAEYRPTDHFLNRRKYRSDPPIVDWAIEELIETGRLTGEDPSKHGDHCFAFEKRLLTGGQHDWRLVVAIRDEAFRDPAAKHRIVSCYCPCHDDERPDCTSPTTCGKV